METSILDLFKLKGRTALVVGGNRGLGLAMAKALAEAGASISIAARDEEKSQSAVALIRSAYGVDCAGFYCDVAVEASVQAAVAHTAKFRKDRYPYQFGGYQYPGADRKIIP